MFNNSHDAIEFVLDTLYPNDNEIVVLNEKDFSFQYVNSFKTYPGITLILDNVGHSGFCLEVELYETPNGKWTVEFDTQDVWCAII